MISLRFLPFMLVLVAVPTVFAHGPAAHPVMTNPLLSEQTTTGAEFHPTYLLAAVCSLHDRHDPHAFERRVELIRIARANTEPAEATEDSAPPLYDGLGNVSYPITTANDRARQYFNQGLRLTYAFNHYEAWRAFRHAQRLDPACAMCHWGEAYALGPNINAPMEPDAVPHAVAAIESALKLSADTTARERTLIAALAKRYSTTADADQAALNQAYARAMADVAARFPDDVDIASLYADALMNLSPWDYWEADGLTLKLPVTDLLETLETALARNPNHPYAIHLYIHALEASAAPARAEAYADRLPEQMPGAGHIVHMPFHIYFNTGRFGDAIRINHAAVAADEAYLGRSPDNEMYAYGYYPHNVHSLLESARMAGDGRTAIAAAGKLPAIMADEVAADIPWIQVIKAAPYFAHAQFSAPDITLALADPGNRFPYVRAMWHYARGVAQAARHDLPAARTEARAIIAIVASTDFSDLSAGGVPAPNLLKLAYHVLKARIAQSQGAFESAIASFEQAVAIQDTLPYLEPPFWYYPVRQSLGAALLQAGNTAAAEQVFRDSLAETPHNGWALYGLLQTQQQQGDAAGAERTRAHLDRVWLGERRYLNIGLL